MSDEKRISEFLAQPDVAKVVQEAKAAGKEPALVRSSWGPLLIVAKPTFEQELAYHASQRHQSPTQQAWGGVRLAENCLLYPDLPSFQSLREKYGYMFADNVAAWILKLWAPEEDGEVKKL